MFEFEDDLSVTAKIKVVGIGGGGGNAIKTMMRARLEGIDFAVINTDIQALKLNDAPTKIQIGSKLTKGLGAGANPEIGRDAAFEDSHLIQEAFKGVDMIFVTAGMGGGTGTGAAPVIAKLAKDLGVLTVGIVTKPFSFEGKKRMLQADEGIQELKNVVDTLICIPNDNLLNLADKNTPIIDSFKMVDQVLLQAVRGISDLITTPGLINLDFADVNTIMRNAGIALMGTGIASGENRALEAAKLAISSPLLENLSVSGATGLLINITGSSNMTLFELNEACKLIQQEAHEDANIIFGSVINDDAGDEISVTVIATGFDKSQLKAITEEQNRTASFSQKNWLNDRIKRSEIKQETPPPANKPFTRDPIRTEKENPFAALQADNEDDVVMEPNTIKDVFSAYEKCDRYGKNNLSLFINEEKNEPAPVVPTPMENNSDWGSENEERAAAPTPGTPFRRHKPISPWGVEVSKAAPLTPRAKRPVGSRVMPTHEEQPVIQEVSIDGDWTRRPAKAALEATEFKRTMRDMSLNQDDDIYDIPAFIRRRAD